jgi:HEAT repeat protein
LDTIGDAYAGTLSLGTMGCSNVMLLVVSGAHAGRILYVDAGHAPPYFVHETDFLSWYERWLDELLAREDGIWFGSGMAGGERVAAAAFADREAPEGVRQEAAATLLRRKTALPETAAIFLRTISDALPTVRVMSVGAIARFRLSDGYDALRACLHDSDAAVRARAVRELAELALGGWIEDVRPCLRDPAHDVASGALFALQKVKALVQGDLVPLLEAPAGETRALALWAGTWTHDDVPRIAPLLDDPWIGARSYAILALRRTAAREHAGAFARRIGVETDLDAIGSLALGLGESGDASIAIPALTSLLAHADDFVQLAAIEALGRLADPRGAALIAPFLTDMRKAERRDARSARIHTKTFAELALVEYEKCGGSAEPKGS